MARETRPKNIILTAVITLAGGLAVVGCGKPEYCQSPRAVSPVYPGDHEPDVSGDSSTWHLGILAVTNQLRADVIVGFEATNGHASWHDSDPVSQDEAGKIALKIGTGDVRFSVSYHAPNGSAACNDKPATAFSPIPLPFNDIRSDATLPTWPSTQ